MNFKSRLIELNLLIWIQLVLLVLLLSTSRQISFFSFVDFESAIIPNSDYFKLIKTGALYDLRAASIAFILFYLIGTVAATHKRIFVIYRYLFSWYSALIGFIFMLTSICNYYYFQTYGNNFDVFIFNAQTEDPQALFKTIWQQYPVISALFISIAFGFFSYKLSKMQSYKKYLQFEVGNLVFLILFIFSLFIYLLATRGSLGTFPLVKSNSQISKILIINELNPNALFSIYWANKDNKANNYSIVPVQNEEGMRLSMKVFNEESIVKKTLKSEYLEKHKPNVVLAIMESMGSNILYYDNPSNNDLLGELREHFNQDFLFENFLGNSFGTKPALATILFKSPYPNISHTQLQKTYIKGNVFETYLKAGYKALFISPSNLKWHNMVNFLTLHNVEVVDENTLMDTYPESAKQKIGWGIPDEYAFKYAKKILEEANQPLLIVIMSISFHAPYHFPKSYVPQRISIHETLVEKMGGNTQDLRRMMQTYQYAANSLGEFISSIKQSQLSNNTIIAATADHQSRDLTPQYPKEIVLNIAVPLYLYLPEPIKQNVNLTYDKHRYGSHKDIFPTLMSYSLSQAEYFNTGGRNLLSPEQNSNYDFGYSEQLWIDKNGAYTLNQSKSFYKWSEEKLLVDTQPTELSSKQIQKIQSYQSFDKWQFNNRINLEKSD